MRLEAIRLKNFRTFRDLELKELPPIAFFVGKNGSGKSTLFKVFAFLKDALENNVRTALQREGGFNEVVSRGCQGESILIEIQFRLEITGVERLVTYSLSVCERQGRPVVEREVLRYKRGRYGSPFHFLDFSFGEGYAVTNEEDFAKTEEELDREHQRVSSPDILAIKGVGQFERFKAANSFRKLIENWHLSDFHIMAARQRAEAGVATHLSETGDNLPLVTRYLFESHPEIFRQILERMKERVPGISDVEPAETIDGHIVLRFSDNSFSDPFVARNVSDGTIKMFAYLVLLNDPSPHPFLCIEEPENQLYPSLLLQLGEELRDYARRGGQVFVTTHSPELLDGASIEEVYCIEKIDGFSSVYRVSEDSLARSLYGEGDPLGALWSQGLLSMANRVGSA